MKDRCLSLFKRIVDNENTTIKEYVIRGLICLIIGILAGICVELIYNRELLSLPEGEKGITPIEFSQIEEGVYRSTFPERYVDKLRYSYDEAGRFSADISFENTSNGTLLLTPDHNNMYFDTSVHKAGACINKITITLTEHGITEGEKLDYPVITGMWIDNTMEFNAIRFLVFAMAVFTIMILILWSHRFSKGLHMAFLVIALAMGVAFFAILPNQKVSWDEGIHFNTAYKTTIGQVGYDEDLRIHSDDGLVWPLNIPQSYEERLMQDDYLDNNLRYMEDKESVTMVDSNAFNIRDVGYLPSSLGLTVGRLLRLDFTKLFLLGRIFNFAAYVALAFFAIRKCPVGKLLMAIIALMPTLIFTATVYSRDAVLNGCVLLGISYYLNMLCGDEEYASWKDYVICLVSLVIACLTKQIYAPLLLLVVLVPKNRFQDKKTMYLMWAGVIVAALLLVASFMMPVATSGGASAGDPRVSEASGSGQLAHIFGAPFGYAGLLLKNIFDNFIDYCAGAGALGAYGHITSVIYPGVIPWLLIFVAVTDTNGKRINAVNKLGILVASFVIMCFIWTSMYLSYTPVGADYIAGVQGRYFIPIIFPLLMTLNFSKVKLEFNKRIYSCVSIFVVVFLQYYTLYSILVTNCG